MTSWCKSSIIFARNDEVLGSLRGGEDRGRRVYWGCFMNLKIFALTILCAAAAVPLASAEVQVSLVDGKVTIVAKDATVRQIMAEWARVGQTKIVNVDRIPG